MKPRALVPLLFAQAVLGCVGDAQHGLFDPVAAADAAPSDTASTPDGAAGADGGKPPDGAAGKGGGPGKDAATDVSYPPEGGCEAGQTLELACGLNGRGTLTSTCQDGAWTAGTCVDPDVCVDGEARNSTCGPAGVGTVEQSCVEGQWKNVGDCAMPPGQGGRWDCVSGTCKPVLGDPQCGDGVCSPSADESPSSCAGDCVALATQNGQGKPCADDLDCAFYAWPHSGPGYWECKWSSGQDYCNAVQTGSFCGTSGYTYCYYGTLGIETPATCPADCANKMLNQGDKPGCGNDRDCIFLDWP